MNLAKADALLAKHDAVVAPAAAPKADARLDVALEKARRLHEDGSSTGHDDTLDIIFKKAKRFDESWDESKHPRGQPENAGQFGPGGQPELKKVAKLRESIKEIPKTINDPYMKKFSGSANKLAQEKGFTNNEQKDALVAYTNSTGIQLMSDLILKNTKHIRWSSVTEREIVANGYKNIAALDQMLDNASTKEPMRVYRGSANVPKKLVVGQDLTFPVYQYSSKNIEYASEFASGEKEETGGKAGWLMEIDVPKGASAIDINGVLGEDTETSFENAILFSRKTIFQVESIDSDKKHVKLKVKIL